MKRNEIQIELDCNSLWMWSQTCKPHVFSPISAAQHLQRVIGCSDSHHPAYSRACRALRRLEDENKLSARRFQGTNQTVYWNPERIKG